MKISVIMGTRPEAIKLAPVIRALRQEQSVQVEVCVTAQHRQMFDQVLEVFGLRPDTDLDLMQPGQTLGDFTVRVVSRLDAHFRERRPDWVLVQGDTATVFCAALAAYYHKISVGHVEAGLRTGDLYSPWPEEGYRTLITPLTRLHFAPTARAWDNLIRENVPAARIRVTGNTVVDALLDVAAEVVRQPPEVESLPAELQPGTFGSGPRMVLITGHRRENFGAGFEAICWGIADLANESPDVHFVYPVHLNPNVREPVQRILAGTCRGNIHLIEPLDYLRFVGLMTRCHFILTDSGGIQEEAPSLGKPVLVMRDTTERPEAIESGVAKLVGANRHRIVEEGRRLLQDAAIYSGMVSSCNPYGDGRASLRIVNALMDLGSGGDTDGHESKYARDRQAVT